MEEPSPDDIADEYETDAHAYFQQNMSMELRNAAATEGAAIGQRTSHHMGDRVRETCEPFERDQEIDTQILNNVFAVTGGAANLTRGLPGGSSSGPTRGINIASRLVNIGINLVAANMPAMAGYKTVGELKDAAVRQLGSEAQQAGETGSAAYSEYENAVMEQLETDWQDDIDAATRRIRTEGNSTHAQNLSRIGRAFWSVTRTQYQDRLRNDYGSGSSHTGTMIGQIDGILNPRLTSLQEHLQEAKKSRERWQALGAVGAGIAGGAAIGAAIGAPAAGIGAVPGAIIGGVVGGTVGTAGAIAILWD